MTVRALISGCAGTRLTEDEISFFREIDPWGLILFARNCETPDQIRDLVSAFRSAVGRIDAPVLIDQEGGRIQRLRPPHWTQHPPCRRYGDLFASDPAEAKRLAGASARLIAYELHDLGINVDCLPVADVPQPGAHDVIGDRAYSEDPDEVSALAGAAAEGLLAGGVLPVLKHIPGHGRAGVDSHVSLPVVDTDIGTLRSVDFVPFRNLRHLPTAMTAHVIYTAIDPDRPATLSPTVISEIVRGEIGFDGLLMTDDLSMGALSGSLAERTAASIEAGCDIALHCNGDMEEMQQVASCVPLLQGVAADRAARALRQIREPDAVDIEIVRGDIVKLC